MMASGQTDLRSFFKTKKNYNEILGKYKVSENITTDAQKANSLVDAAVKKSHPSEAGNDLHTSENASKKSPKRKIDSEPTISHTRKRHLIEEEPPNSNQPGITKYFNTSEGKANECRSFKQVKRKLHLSESQNSNVNNLKPEEVKQRLGKCSRLDELRAKLLKLNQCEEKLKEFRQTSIATSYKTTSSSPHKNEKLLLSPRKDLRMSPYKIRSCVPPSPHKLRNMHPQLEHFKALDVEVPVSPTKSPMKQTPSKLQGTPTKVPCYERFSHLASDDSRTLSLPYKYQLMNESFSAVDTVVSLMHNRQEMITYTRLKEAVQGMLRKVFNEKNLGQIKTIFPLAYFFRQEKVRNYHEMDSNKHSSYQLTVSANLDYKKQSSVATNLLDRLEDCSKNVKSISQFRKMDSIVLVERRHVFHQSLLKILENRHNEFLQTLDPPITLTGSLKHWHPEFALEDVPEPEASSLPKPPTLDIPKTAEEVFAKARSLYSINDRMKSALESAASNIATKESQSESSAKPISPNPQIAAALKGVSLSLLEKIRAREAAKAEREMTRSQPETKQLAMLSRLPEIVRIIRNFFVAEKRAALARDIVAAKIVASYSSILAAKEVDAHIDLLMKEVPGWCSVHKVQSGIYLKIDKKRELQNIISILQNSLKAKS